MQRLIDCLVEKYCAAAAATPVGSAFSTAASASSDGGGGGGHALPTPPFALSFPSFPSGYSSPQSPSAGQSSPRRHGNVTPQTTAVKADSPCHIGIQVIFGLIFVFSYFRIFEAYKKCNQDRGFSLSRSRSRSLSFSLALALEVSDSVSFYRTDRQIVLSPSLSSPLLHSRLYSLTHSLRLRAQVSIDFPRRVTSITHLLDSNSIQQVCGFS